MQITRSQQQGLTSEQAAAARQQHGWNELPKPDQISPLRILLRQFSSFLVLILMAAGGIAFFLGEVVDTIAIGLVVLLNAALGFVQEWRAETALETLRSMLSPQALVIRDGREMRIPARDLVPDDLIVLNPGDRVPADAKTIDAVALRVDESILTGESAPVDKAKSDDLMTGTSVVAGRARARVFATGTHTAFGEIAELTGSLGQKQTHLQKQLGTLATQLGIAAIGVAAAILSIGLVVGRDTVEMLMTALSLSVAMVPEGLPAVVTITLALGAAAMVRQQALTRRLQAIETLGAASVICTDKTGTLTENKMTATEIWTPVAQYTVAGTGYDPSGHITRNGVKARAADDTVLMTLLRTGMVCSHAQLRRDGHEWVMTGDPTEGALLTLGYKGWCDPGAEITDEIPFSSDRKRMSVMADGVIYAKGAPEQVLAICSEITSENGVVALDETRSGEVIRAYEAMAAKGFRVIALANRNNQSSSLVEKNLTFLGLVGIIDPPRPEVGAAVAAAKSAGIRIIMITGDSPVTAKAIASQLNLNVEQAITGDALAALSDEELRTTLSQPILFARTRPADKMRIVAALQADGQVIAMTGDGVNDAPALKQADIGVAMGIRGTDVARDAADLVLLDDNFATIVAAVREGRRQFDNIRKFVRYLLSSNAGEVVAIFANIVIGGPLIFLATQILWMNLVTDGVTAVALGLEKSEPGQMKEPPRPMNSPILGWGGIALIITFGCYTGGAALWVFWQLVAVDVDLARTAAFTAMVIFEKASVFAFRSLRSPCWQIGWLSNRTLIAALFVTIGAQVVAVYWAPLQVLLHTVPLDAAHWIMIALLALPLIIVPELVKTLWRQRLE